MRCFACGKKMARVPLPRGAHGLCVRCPACRARARRYHHQMLRARANVLLKQGFEVGPYLRRFLGHKCTRSC